MSTTEEFCVIFIGTKVFKGEYPFNEKRLGKIIQDISYYNTKEYFGF